jgi:uncharacterized small protein (DUF1192 family)
VAYRSKSDETVKIEQSLKIHYEQIITQIGRDNDEANRKLKDASDVGRRCYELENQVVILKQEIERLQLNLREKQDEYNRLEQTARNQGRDIDEWRKRYSDLEANSRHTLEVEVIQKFNLY